LHPHPGRTEAAPALAYLLALL